MRKANKLLIALLCAMGTATIAASCACSQGDGKTQLVAPEISANDNGIFWSQVVGAESYNVKMNDGAWQSFTAEQRSYAFPQSVGTYTFSVTAAGSSYWESSARTLEFSVKQAQASVVQTDNVLTFTGENIVYSVNDGAYGELSAEGVIDFSSAAIGTTYSVSYYTKGGYYVEGEKSYYVDGAVQTVQLTVTQTLAAPVLTVNANADGLTWSAVENGASYEITVDGEVSTIAASQERAVAFPKTPGEHTITVKALENGLYKSSVASVYQMTTSAVNVPTVTYDKTQGSIVWDTKYESIMLSNTKGEFASVNASSIAYTQGLQLKTAQTYDEQQRVLYLESKPLSITNRQAPQISFAKEGAIAWNTQDTGSAKRYYYSLVPFGNESSYSFTAGNTLNVASFAKGEYQLFVYGDSYLEETAEQAVLYLTGDSADISFKVLGAPELNFTTGKLLWTDEDDADAYQIKVEDGEWTTATLTGEYATTDFATYYVRAVGKDTGSEYVVTSKISSLRFDPTLLESKQSVEFATFSSDKYLANVSASMEGNTTSGGITQVLTSSTDTNEQAILAGANGGVLKLTASKASPKNENTWGNFDGITFNFFKSFAGANGGRLLVRMYMTSNPNRAFKGADDDTSDTDGGWKAYATEEKDDNGYTIYERRPEDIEGYITYELYRKDGTAYNFWRKQIQTDTWVDLLVDVPADWSAEEITGFSVNFHENGQAGDAIYIDEIKWVNPKLAERTVEFDTNADNAKIYAYSFVSKQGVELVKDSVNSVEKTVLKAKNVWRSDGLRAVYDNLFLKAGTTITVTLKAAITDGEQTNTGGGIYLNGKTDWKVNFAATGAWNTVSFALAQDTTLTDIYIWQYDSQSGYDIYVESIVIEGAIVITTSEVTFTDAQTAETYKKAFSYSGNFTATLETDATYGTVLKQSSMWANNSDGTQRGLIVTFDNRTFTTAATITIVLKLEGTSAAHDWLAAGINGTENTDGCNTPNGVWTTVTVDIPAGTTLSSLYLNSTTNAHSFNLYIASITIA